MKWSSTNDRYVDDLIMLSFYYINYMYRAASGNKTNMKRPKKKRKRRD